MIHVGSNLTVPNFHCREFDATILIWILQAVEGGDDHVVACSFGCVVLEKFNEEVPS